MIETKDRSLEEIDTMYISNVNPITSAKWNATTLETQGPSSIRGLQGVSTGAVPSINENSTHPRSMLESAKRQVV
jgi:SP family sugar:H+ symporter-like MFS transporter